MKQKLGNLIFIVLVVLTVAVWIVFPPASAGVDVIFIVPFHAAQMGGTVLRRVG